jgi:hypothetical protein
MEVILKEDILNLGYKDDIVNVKKGYARNYLIPQGKAIIANESAKKVLAENQKQRAHKLAQIKADAQAVADKMEGVYRANQYGIRIENLIVTQEYRKTEEFGTFYNFETITLCPIDTRPISKKLLTKCEKKWLNKYHKMVYKKLKNHLSVEEKTWLKNKTKPI